MTDIWCYSTCCRLINDPFPASRVRGRSSKEPESTAYFRKNDMLSRWVGLFSWIISFQVRIFLQLPTGPRRQVSRDWSLDSMNAFGVWSTREAEDSRSCKCPDVIWLDTVSPNLSKQGFSMNYIILNFPGLSPVLHNVCVTWDSTFSRLRSLPMLDSRIPSGN